MFPDLRLLISATVVTFFLAATAGLYASLRITQDQIAARNDGRGEDSPIARISASWPAPEPGRTAALWELTKIARSPPVIAADESADAPERGDIDVPDTAIASPTHRRQLKRRLRKASPVRPAPQSSRKQEASIRPVIRTLRAISAKRPRPQTRNPAPEKRRARPPEKCSPWRRKSRRELRSGASRWPAHPTL